MMVWSPQYRVVSANADKPLVLAATPDALLVHPRINAVARLDRLRIADRHAPRSAPPAAERAAEQC